MYRLVEQLDWDQEKIIGTYSFRDHAVEAAQQYLKEHYQEWWLVDIDLSEFNIVMRWFGRGKSLTVYAPETHEIKYEYCR